MNIIKILVFISAISFLIYGITCLFSNQMKSEFIRFGVPHFRILTGLLEIAGGLGQIIGWYFSPILLLFSTFGLALLMSMGFIVRLRIKDTLWQSSPALIFMIINLYIFLKFAL